MDINKYLVYNVQWQPCTGINEDTQMSEYGEAVSIKCLYYGKDVFLREGSGGATISAKAYIVLDPVKPRDILDGQVVKSVNNYPTEFIPGCTLYEALTWNS